MSPALITISQSVAPLSNKASCRRDHFCQSCYTSLHKSNATLSDELTRAHKEQIKRGEDIKLMFKKYLFEQSVKCLGARDATQFLKDGAVVVHWTTVDDLAKWEGNGMGDIVLKPNISLKESTLDQYSHYENTHNKSDTCVWGTINVLGGKQFMQGHHKYTITPGTTWHILVFTRDSASGRLFSQFKWDRKSVSPKHELMVNTQGAKKKKFL